MTYPTTGAEILTAAGKGSPTAEETAWAAACALAVNAAIATLLDGFTVTAGENPDDELARSAILDGVEAFRAKDARMGILSVGPDGEPMRVSTDILWSIPVIRRYVMPGIG